LGEGVELLPGIGSCGGSHVGSVNCGGVHGAGTGSIGGQPGGAEGACEADGGACSDGTAAGVEAGARRVGVYDGFGA
jgi:hypothetical protein